MFAAVPNRFRGFAVIWTLLASFLILAPRMASGAPLTFQFTGAVSQPITADPDDPFGGSIGFGTPVAGSYTFDTASTDQAPDAQTGSYNSVGPPYQLVMTIGGFTFTADTLLNIGVANDFAGPVDQYTLFGIGPDNLQVSILFQDFTSSVFNNDSLPLAPPDAASFLSRTFLLTIDLAGNQVQIDGTIDSITATAVPEPGGLCLMLLAAAGWTAIYNRRRK